MEYDFDVMLHRTIRQGNEFDKLIPAYSNTSINFEKSSKEILESDTFDTLRFINQWVDKYHSQMSKVAPLLKGNSKAETAKNIYSWLYNHFQYKLDTSPFKQRLFSPAAAWHFRASGIDCKSFSLVASCILTELKIPNSLRMVKQEGVKSGTDHSKWIVNPNYWSHVYVIVPDGNKTLIIDATTHDNKEVAFVTKHDHKIMIHQGLNGAYSKQRSGLGCSCSGTSVQKTGLGNPTTLGFAISNFHRYLNELEREGVSREITNRMLSLVRYNVDRGIDPNMEEILMKATSGSQLGSPFSNLFNQGAANIKGQVNNAVNQGVVNVKGQVNNLVNQGVANVKGQINSGINNVSVGGVKLSDAAAIAGGDYSSVEEAAGNKLKEFFSKINPVQFIGSTFGSVFANGFDTSCWRASIPSDKVKKEIQEHIAPHFEAKLKAIKATTDLATLEGKINDYFTELGVAKGVMIGKDAATNWSSCSRKGIKLYLDFIKKLHIDFLAIVNPLLGKGYMLTTISMSQSKIKLGNITYDETGHTKPYVVFQFKKMSIPQNGGANPQNAGVNPQNGGANPQNGGVNPQNGNTPKKDEGISPVLLLTGVGIALKLLL